MTRPPHSQVDDQPQFDEQLPLQIGEWLLDPAAHSLAREGQIHRLPKRLIRLLVLLASRPGQTWSREELLQAAWTRRVVNDEVLSRAIAELRALLDDDARAPRYIETLPKTGYRLIAEVVQPGATRSDTQAAAQPSAAPAQARHSSGSSPVPTWPRFALRRGMLALLVLILSIWILDHVAGPDRAGLSSGDQSADVTDAPAWSIARMTTEQPFLSGQGWERQPRFSADGRWLLYVSENPDSREISVFYAKADGSAARRLELGPGRLNGPVFSPDASSVAVMAFDDNRCALRIKELPSGTPRDLTECAALGSRLDWPQSDQLLYTAPALAAQGAAIWAIDPASRAAQQMTRPTPEDIADTHPRARADGAIAFSRGPYRQQKIWLQHDGVERLILDSADRIPDLSWVEQGAALLIASDRAGFPALHRLDVAAGTTTLLGGRGAATLDVSVGDALLYEQRRYDANLWLYRPGVEPRQLTSSTRYEAYPAVSPDGSRVTFVSNRDGNASIWVQDLDSGAERRLRLPEALAWVRPSWLDDATIAVTRYNQMHDTDLHSYDLGADMLVQHAVMNGPGMAGQALAGGGHVFAEERSDGRGMRLLLHDGAAAYPVPGAESVGEFATAGDWLVWQQRGVPGLVVRTLQEAQKTRHLPPIDSQQDYFAWALAGDYLVYAAEDDTGWQLWRRRLDDEHAGAEHWMDLRGSPSDAKIALAPDSSFAIVSHIDAFSADLMRVAPR